MKIRSLKRSSVTRSTGLLALAAMVCALSTSCARTVRPARVATLQDLRTAAGRSNATPEQQRVALLAELVAPGGDPSRAQPLFDSSQALQDLRVRYARALWDASQGRFVQAREGLVAVIVGAHAGSPEPLAQALGELAIPRLLSLRADAPGFAAVFTPLVDRVAQDPGHLGPAATYELLESATRWAREKGDLRALDRWLPRVGCATQWRVAGAFGPYTMLRFDEALAAQGPGPMAAAYDLGPGRGRQPTYDVFARGCAANLGIGRTQEGVFVAGSDVVIERDTQAILRVETPNVFAVYVDGEEVARSDSRERPTSTMVRVRLSLTAGHHALRVKIGSRYFSPLLIASLLDERGAPVGRFAPSGAAVSVGSVRAEPYVQSMVASDPFARFVLAQLAFGRRDAVAARELLRPIATDESPALTLMMQAELLLADPFLPAQIARDRARHVLETAMRRDPLAFFPPLALARLAAADDRADAALRASRDAWQRFAGNPEVAADYMERLLDRSWDGEVAEILQTVAPALGSEVCWPQRMAFSLAQRRGDGELERTLATALSQCDTLSEASTFTSMRQRRWDDAAVEYSRLFSGDAEARSRRRALAELQRQAGHLSEAREAIAPLLPEHPEDTTLRLDLADLHTALGDPRAAQSMIETEFARSPGPMSELLRVHASLARRDALDPWRLNGREVLAAYRPRAARYDDGQVLVLDYTVRRVFADGSALELTHNILDLRTQEAVDEHATFTPPPGATLTLLRTHKADGRVLEPEAIARLDAVAYPDVRPGDAVEYEFVRTFGVNEATPGGFHGERFYFQGTEMPYDRTELLVVVPTAMESQLVFSPRGPAPTVTRTERNGALVELRWGFRESRRREAEPMSVAFREFTPSIDLGVACTWPAFIQVLRDRLAEQSPIDPDAERLVRQLVGSVPRRAERLARLYRWVVAHIDQEGAGTPFASAPAMLAARSGHRGRVLEYMLRLADVPVTLALVRPGFADRTESPLADEETFQSLILRVETEDGVRWVSASDRDAPLGYIPPALSGQPTMLVREGAPHEEIPAAPPHTHSRSIEVTLDIAADGGARGAVIERLRGSWGVSWRDSLRRIDAANLERNFEGYVGRQVTAASLVDLHIDNREQSERDLVMRYGFTAPDVAVVAADGTLSFEGAFPALLAATYAARPQRTVALYHPETVDATLELRVNLPAGARFELPATRQETAPEVQWSLRYERTPTGFVVHRTVEVPGGRVSVARYPVFAESIRALDRAEQQRVSITLP
ncbi:MAG: hypothetical protein Q8Q09_03585 [Deltaproteobacteria bacterium]|nr:hypothetical protein [Deltaproteobacteria bacterium]